MQTPISGPTGTKGSFPSFFHNVTALSQSLLRGRALAHWAPFLLSRKVLKTLRKDVAGFDQLCIMAPQRNMDTRGLLILSNIETDIWDFIALLYF